MAWDTYSYVNINMKYLDYMISYVQLQIFLMILSSNHIIMKEKLQKYKKKTIKLLNFNIQ